MSFETFLNIFPDHPILAAITWFFVIVVMLYLARKPAHRAIKSLSRVIYNGLRIAARSLLLAEKRWADRNKDVLLASGREAVEQAIEREFQRVDAVVKRDLSAFPTLQLKLSDQISQIDANYRESAVVPPAPPVWVNAVKALAKIPTNADITMATIFGEIHKTITKEFENSMSEYKKNMAVRHTLLKNMLPYWRSLTRTLDEVVKKVSGVQERAKVIDRKMEEYEEIRSQTVKAEQMLSSSSLTQFVTSAFVLLVAAGGAIINFNLIALPMSEMVGGGSYLGQFKTSNVAALVIILVEVTMGLYLMESLRITKLFPVIGSLDDKMRRRMIWVSFGILFILASVEASLAFMRDQIAADMQALRQSLSSAETIEPIHSWIPTAGQMVMGFFLPFALTFVAIPLESFIASSRTVIGKIIAAFMHVLAFLCRLVGNIALYLGEFMINIYDLLIFPPLWFERFIKEKGAELGDLVLNNGQKIGKLIDDKKRNSKIKQQKEAT